MKSIQYQIVMGSSAQIYSRVRNQASSYVYDEVRSRVEPSIIQINDEIRDLVPAAVIVENPDEKH